MSRKRENESETAKEEEKVGDAKGKADKQEERVKERES